MWDDVVSMDTFDQFIDKRAFQKVASPGRFLTADQIEAYNRDGCLIVRGALDREVVRTLKQTADRLYGEVDNDWIQGGELRDKTLHDYIHSHVVQSIVGDLNGPSEVVFTFLLRKRREFQNFKSWHQDHVYWDPSDARVMAVFSPLTPIHRGNGAISFIPGSHRLGRLFHHAGPNANLVCDTSAFREPVEVELEPGDVMALHSLTLHRSPENQSSDERINFGIHFHHRDTRIVRDVHSAKLYDT